MKKQITRDEILNGWLKYHNTTVEEVIKKHTTEELSSPDWFKIYEVTQEQHDEWQNWAKELIRKRYKYSKKMVDKGWWIVYFDNAPNIKKMANKSNNKQKD
jgi:hypothetical protein